MVTTTGSLRFAVAAAAAALLSPLLLMLLPFFPSPSEFPFICNGRPCSLHFFHFLIFFWGLGSASEGGVGGGGGGGGGDPNLL